MALLFGLSFVVTKYALKSIQPFTLIFLRFLIALLFLGIYYLSRHQRSLLPGDRAKMFLTSLIVPGLYFLAETYGLKLSSAASVSLLVATIPIFTSLFAFLLLKEKIPFWRGVGIILSVIGVVVILSSSPATGSFWKLSAVGNFLGLGAAICAALYMALGRNLLLRYSPLTITTFQALSAVIIFFPLATMEWTFHGWQLPDATTFGAILY